MSVSHADLIREALEYHHPLSRCESCQAGLAAVAVWEEETSQREAQTLRLAQGLRVIRDTTAGYPANVAERALEEAGVPDPPEEDHL